LLAKPGEPRTVLRLEPRQAAAPAVLPTDHGGLDQELLPPPRRAQRTLDHRVVVGVAPLRAARVRRRGLRARRPHAFPRLPPALASSRIRGPLSPTSRPSPGAEKKGTSPRAVPGGGAAAAKRKSRARVRSESSVSCRAARSASDCLLLRSRAPRLRRASSVAS